MFSREADKHFQDPPIAARADGIRTPDAYTVTTDRVIADKDGKKVVTSHRFLAEITHGVYGFLPEGKAINAVPTTSKDIKLNSYQFFKSGDKLYFVDPLMRVTFTSTTSGATFTAGYLGYTDTYAFQGTNGVSDGSAASEFAGFINKSNFLSRYLYALSDGTTAYVFVKDGRGLTPLTVTATGATVTSNPVGGAFQPYLLIGEVDKVDASTWTVTLKANAAVAVPAGACVGIPVKRIVGYHPHSVSFDNNPERKLVAIEAASIYLSHMPYWRYGIQQWVPDIKPTMEGTYPTTSA